MIGPWLTGFRLIESSAFEGSANNFKTPLSFADQLFVLREYISGKRLRLLKQGRR